MTGEVVVSKINYGFVRSDEDGADYLFARSWVAGGRRLHEGAPVSFDLLPNPRRPTTLCAMNLFLRKLCGFARGLPWDATWAEVRDAVAACLGGGGVIYGVKVLPPYAWIEFIDRASFNAALAGAIEFRGAPLKIVEHRPRPEAC